MEKSIISEGKTTNEAIENGLKELNVSKNMVDIKVLEEEQKRSFFSILTPRVVKVKLTLKEQKTENKTIKKEKKEIKLSEEEQEKAVKNIDGFLKEFIQKVDKNASYSIEKSAEFINVYIKDKDLGFLIGYRGETLYALQNILSAIAGKALKIELELY